VPGWALPLFRGVATRVDGFTADPPSTPLPGRGVTPDWTLPILRDVGTRVDGFSAEADPFALNVRDVIPDWKLSFSRGVATRVDGFSTGLPSRRGCAEGKLLCRGASDSVRGATRFDMIEAVDRCCGAGACRGASARGAADRGAACGADCGADPDA